MFIELGRFREGARSVGPGLGARLHLGPPGGVPPLLAHSAFFPRRRRWFHCALMSEKVRSLNAIRRNKAAAAAGGTAEPRNQNHYGTAERPFRNFSESVRGRCGTGSEPVRKRPRDDRSGTAAVGATGGTTAERRRIGGAASSAWLHGPLYCNAHAQAHVRTERAERRDPPSPLLQ